MTSSDEIIIRQSIKDTKLYIKDLFESIKKSKNLLSCLYCLQSSTSFHYGVDDAINKVIKELVLTIGIKDELKKFNKECKNLLKRK